MVPSANHHIKNKGFIAKPKNDEPDEDAPLRSLIRIFTLSLLERMLYRIYLKYLDRTHIRRSVASDQGLHN